MNLSMIIKLLPLAGPIQKMLEVLERLENDPEVKAAFSPFPPVSKARGGPLRHLRRCTEWGW